MGRLKDGLFTEVWKHLQTIPHGRTLLTSLNSPLHGPQAIRTAWSELQAHGRLEGLKKKTGLQAVLAERADLFQFTTTEKGHLLIELTQAALLLDPREAIPAAGPAPEGVAGLEGGGAELQEQLGMQGTPADVSAEASIQALMADLLPESATPGLPPGPVGGDAAPMGSPGDAGGAADWMTQPGMAAPDPDGPPAKRQRAYAYAVGWRGKGRGKSGFFQDLVWTPAIHAAREAERKKESEMARALFNSLEMHSGQTVTLSQIGSDYKVAQLKKDTMFKNIRLLDILRQYDDVFELTPDNITGGWTVRLQPGAEAALPDAEAMLEQELRETDLMLPDRIENPMGAKEKMQALRIELLHALSRRGGRVPLQELGQEPRVQQRKQGLHQAKKLGDFVRLFPENFKVVADDMQMMVETVSTKVRDTSMIDQSIVRNNQQMNQFPQKGGGRGGRIGQGSCGRYVPAPYPPVAPPPPAPVAPHPSQPAWLLSQPDPMQSSAFAALLQQAAHQAAGMPAGFIHPGLLRPS